MAMRQEPNDGVTIYQIKEQMSEMFTDVATGLALTSLSHQTFIESFQEENYQGNVFTAWRLTAQGERWLLDHQDKLQLSKK
jgi:hypothetical protein